jgi:hypothetical protein
MEPQLVVEFPFDNRASQKRPQPQHEIAEHGLLASQGDERVDLRRAPRRQIGGERRHETK